MLKSLQAMGLPAAEMMDLEQEISNATTSADLAAIEKKICAPKK